MNGQLLLPGTHFCFLKIFPPTQYQDKYVLMSSYYIRCVSQLYTCLLMVASYIIGASKNNKLFNLSSLNQIIDGILQNLSCPCRISPQNENKDEERNNFA